jgi:DNA mismatch repair protein MutS2
LGVVSSSVKVILPKIINFAYKAGMGKDERYDWLELLEKTATYASSQLGRELVHNTMPLNSAEQAMQQFAEIIDVSQILTRNHRPSFESIDVFQNWFERIRRKAILKTAEFLDVRSFCMECIDLQNCLKEENLDWARQQKELLMDARKPLSAIDQIMLADGTIRTDASETLYKLHNEKQAKQREISSTLDRLVKTHEMEPILQDRYVTNREGRWVLPVKSGMQSQVDGIIHDASQTKQTVFMEPQAIVTTNNRLRQIEIDIEKEIKKLLTNLSSYLGTLSDELENSFEVMKLADVRFAQATMTNMIDGHRCEFSDKEFNLLNLKHPLLVLQAKENDIGETVIPNDVQFPEEKRLLLLSGPNAGGKTVLLKAIGLAAQMARCGLPICCDEESSLPFFKSVHVIVGDAQSVDENLSTFAAHLQSLAEGLKLNGQDSLLLIDEICGSTDPEEGAALARSFIEKYSENGIFGIITSHLGPLKEGWQETRVISGSMEYDDRVSRPTFQLFLGSHGRSLAIKTAKTVGVPMGIVDRALSLISPEARLREEKLDELEDYKNEVLQMRRNLDQQLKEARENRRKYFDLIEKFRAEREHWLKKTIEKGQKKIDAMVREFRESRGEGVSVVKVRSEFPKIIRAPERQRIQNVDEFIENYPPGTKVRIMDLGREGVITDGPNKKGEIPVLSESMRLFVSWKNLQAVAIKKPAGSLSKGPRGPSASSGSDETLRTYDLRGQRVEQALDALDRDLDEAMKNQILRIKVVHGHGTDALKKAVRKFLSESIYIKSWKAGDDNSGGDGVTWAELG